MHDIGIDFGTTKTLVSRIKAKTGEAETIRLGQGSDHIATSIFIKDNGEMLFGDDAEDRLTDPDGVYLRGFKMHLGASTPVYAQMNAEGELIQYMATDLVTRYLSNIRTQVQETVFAGEPITRAVITRPVEFSPARCEELRIAAIAAGFNEVELTTEPEAAGLAFCKLNDSNTFRHSALIVDWGGGTLDFSLVTRDHDRVITHPEYTAGDMTIGGERFDYLLWNYVEAELHKQGITNVDSVAMLPVVRKNKEKLSVSESTSLRLSHSQGGCPPIELSQKLLNSLINESVDLAANKIMKLLEQIPADDKPEMLLLVGGSCRIPYIKHKLEEVCKLPAISWHLSREAVSLGAALWHETKSEHTPTSKLAKTISPSGKRTFKHITMLGILLTATTAPFVYQHFQQRNDEISQNEEKAEAQAKAIAEEEARKKAEAQAKAIAEEETRKKAEAQAKAIAEEEARKKAETQAKAIAEEEARKKAEAQAKAIAEEEARKKAEAQAKAIAEEEARKKAEARAKAIAEEEARQKAAIEAWFRQIPQAQYTTTLISAAKSNNIEAIKLLINAGADVNGYTHSNPLAEAAKNGHSQCIDLLLKAGADVNKIGDESRTPLGAAAKNGHSQCVKILLDAGANVNKTNFLYKTPLFDAAEGGNIECVKLLLDAGANVNRANEWGETALFNAAEKGNAECIKLLLDAGANVDKANVNNGRTPLFYAVSSGNLESIKTLLAAGANVNKADEDGETPIFEAKGTCVMFLVEAGADKNKIDKYGYSPIFKAAINGDYNTLKALIEVGCDAQKGYIDGWTPLHGAAYADSAKCVQLLLENGADVNKVDKEGRTPLHRAAEPAGPQCVQLLLDAGANVNKKDKYGKTPLTRFKEEENSKCIPLLEAAASK